MLQFRIRYAEHLLEAIRFLALRDAIESVFRNLAQSVHRIPWSAQVPPWTLDDWVSKDGADVKQPTPDLPVKIESNLVSPSWTLHLFADSWTWLTGNLTAQSATNLIRILEVPVHLPAGIQSQQRGICNDFVQTGRRFWRMQSSNFPTNEGMVGDSWKPPWNITIVIRNIQILANRSYLQIAEAEGSMVPLIHALQSMVKSRRSMFQHPCAWWSMPWWVNVSGLAVPGTGQGLCLKDGLERPGGSKGWDQGGDGRVAGVVMQWCIGKSCYRELQWFMFIESLWFTMMLHHVLSWMYKHALLSSTCLYWSTMSQVATPSRCLATRIVHKNPMRKRPSATAWRCRPRPRQVAMLAAVTWGQRGEQRGLAWIALPCPAPIVLFGVLLRTEATCWVWRWESHEFWTTTY